MTLIFPDSAVNVLTREPRLHALIIGVAHYPHLSNGGGARGEYTFQLGQVRSPKPSAVAIADWFLTEYNNDKVPLGSIELLVSPDDHIDAPTLANIQTAADAWLERCDGDEGNIALFYFCGHGLGYRGIDYLLPQDFADPANKGHLWKNSIDFSTFRTNMERRCRAQTQIFLGDACRDEPKGLDLDPPNNCASLVGGNNTAPLPQSRIYLHAAIPGQKVHVPVESELTCFAQGLLHCLNGGGAETTPGKDEWRVTTFTMVGRMMKLTSLAGERYHSEQVIDVAFHGKEVSLHWMKTPLVPGRIDCETQKARDQSHIRLAHNLRHIDPKSSARGTPRPWYDEFAQGDWQIEVDFDELSPVSGQVKVHPPFFDYVVKA